MNEPGKDVGRLILRHFSLPVEAWGLRGTNRFWRKLINDAYAAYAKDYLMDANNRPWGYQFLDAGQWIDCAARNGASHHLLTLTIYMQRSVQLRHKALQLHMECDAKRKAIQRAQCNVYDRRDQIATKRWGVGSFKKNRDGGGPIDQAYTVRKLAEAQEKLAMLQNDEVYEGKVFQAKQVTTLDDALHVHIRSYYERGGFIRCWEGHVRNEAFIRCYPQEKREAKRKIDEARDDLKRIQRRYKQAKMDLGLDSSE